VDGEDRFCLCYLTTAENLRNAQGDIKLMEASILSRNPHLYRYFNESTQLYDEPLAISQINFQPKSIVKNHILMTGDAARLVAPLSGNGMSMAMHGASLAAPLIHDFLKNRINRKSMESEYTKMWKKHFRSRVRLNKIIQTFFFRQRLIDSSLKFLEFIPPLVDSIIRGTHGRPFKKPSLR
jgi:flavin-dependent dehydrogenase